MKAFCRLSVIDKSIFAIELKSWLRNEEHNCIYAIFQVTCYCRFDNLVRSLIAVFFKEVIAKISQQLVIYFNKIAYISKGDYVVCVI